MDGNKDEAHKCLSIAQRHRDSGNFSSARKFCLKSIALFSTPEAVKLLESIEKLESTSNEKSDYSASSSTQGSSGTFTSGTESHPSASGSKHRQTTSAASSSKKDGTASGSGGEKREYTAENVAVVKRVRACAVTQYYEILDLSKDCAEADIKKAYRKLALQLHPDKNGAPGADEAFKLVSKAFQILSDPQKRAAFDQHGSDPDSRFAGMSSSNGTGFPTSAFGGGGGFEGELSPEDLFNMFFGGGAMGGGPFGNGPGVFTASFGPGGFRTTRVRMGGRGGNRGQRAEATPRSIITQLAPILLLFIFTFLSAIPNLFSSPPTPDPRFSFHSTTRYNMERHTSDLNIRYHVNSAEFSTHPIASDLARAQQNKQRSSLLDKFDRTVERTYTQELYNLCQRGMDNKSRRKEMKSGFLGIGADWDAIKKIDEEKVESCEELRRLGLLV